MTSGTLLGHIVSHEGIAMDLDKVQAILNALAPSTTKALSRFLGQIRWHSRMLQYLAGFTTPLHAVVHRVPFQWSTVEEEAVTGSYPLSYLPVVLFPLFTFLAHGQHFGDTLVNHPPFILLFISVTSSLSFPLSLSHTHHIIFRFLTTYVINYSHN